MRLMKTAVAVGVAALVAGSAHAYIELIDFDTIGGGLSVDRIYSHAFDGSDTVYAQLWGGAGVGGGRDIVKLTKSGDAWSRTVLVDTPTWQAASGESGLTTFYGFGQYGDFIQFTDSASDAVWRVDKMSGVLSSYVSATEIQAFTGQTSTQLLTPSVIAADGEMVFYEGRSKDILRSTGPGAVAMLISGADRIGAFGNDAVSGGMTYDAAGNLYWGNNTSEALARRAPDGTLDWALTTGDITAVTGDTRAGFGPVEYGQDGKVYFYESRSKALMAFRPSDPAGTLGIVLTEADFLAGPAGSTSMGTLSWYDSGTGMAGLTWTKVANTGGIYLVPEPGVLALLALGGLGFVRRLRRR